MNGYALKAKALKETLKANGFTVKVRKAGNRPRVGESTHYVLVFKPGNPDEARKVAEAQGWRYVYNFHDSEYTALGMEAPR